MMTIVMVMLSLISVYALMTRFDRMAFAMGRMYVWASIITGVQLVLDVALTVGIAMGASALMGVLMGGPVGVFIGLLFSYRIENWYKTAPGLRKFRKEFKDAKQAEKLAVAAHRQAG